MTTKPKSIKVYRGQYAGEWITLSEKQHDRLLEIVESGRCSLSEDYYWENRDDSEQSDDEEDPEDAQDEYSSNYTTSSAIEDILETEADYEVPKRFSFQEKFMFCLQNYNTEGLGPCTDDDADDVFVEVILDGDKDREEIQSIKKIQSRVARVIKNQ